MIYEGGFFLTRSIILQKCPANMRVFSITSRKPFTHNRHIMALNALLQLLFAVLFTKRSKTHTGLLRKMKAIYRYYTCSLYRNRTDSKVNKYYWFRITASSWKNQTIWRWYRRMSHLCKFNGMSFYQAVFHTVHMNK